MNAIAPSLDMHRRLRSIERRLTMLELRAPRPCAQGAATEPEARSLEGALASLGRAVAAEAAKRAT